MTRRNGVRALLIAAVLLSLLLASSASAAPRGNIWDPFAEASWSVATGGAPASSDEATDVVMAAGGVTWVCGGLENAGGTDLSLTKIVGGVRKWTKVYDAGGYDVAAEVAPGPGGVVYTVGSSQAGVTNACIIVKWSSSGAILWHKRFSGADFGAGLAVDRQGNVAVCGWKTATKSAVMRSYAPNGSVRWTWRHAPGTGGAPMLSAACAAADGSVYAAGYVLGDPAAALTVRIGATGRRLWLKTYRGAEGLGASASAVAPCPTGGVYVCGGVQSSASSSDGFVMRYSPTGSRKVFTLDAAGGGPHNQFFNDLAVTSTKKVVAVGYSSASGTRDCRAMVYDGDGTWADAGHQQVTPGAFGNDEFTCVAADPMGGYVAAGYWWASSTNRQVCVLRRSTYVNGADWAAVFSGYDSSLAGATSVATRGSAVVVAGRYQATATSGLDQIVLGFVY